MKIDNLLQKMKLWKKLSTTDENNISSWRVIKTGAAEAEGSHFARCIAKALLGEEKLDKYSLNCCYLQYIL